MTVPVMDTTQSSESISMTAPVMDTLSSNGRHIIAFTLPSIYTLKSLPKPDNPNIYFRSIVKSKRAVVRYSWHATDSRVNSKKKSLKEFLARDGIMMQ